MVHTPLVQRRRDLASEGEGGQPRNTSSSTPAGNLEVLIG